MQLEEISIPVNPLTTAEPPRSNIAVTIMLVINANTRKTLWELLPYLARIISRKVCAFGAFRFNSIAKIPNNKT